MRSKVMSVVFMLALVLTGAAKCEAHDQQADPRQPGNNQDPIPTRAPAGGKVQPDPMAQAPAPKADPMACEKERKCDPKQYVSLVLAWFGEKRGTITVYLDGVKVETIRSPQPTKVARHYTGGWQKDYYVAGHTSIGFDWAPDVSRMPAQCSIWHDGHSVDYQGVDTGPCATNWPVS